MLFWLIIIVLLTISALLYQNSKNNKIRVIALILVYSLLISLLGFRSYSMGLGDVENVYIPVFNQYVKNMDILFIINNTPDPVFYLVVKIIYSIFNNFQACLFFYALFVISALLYSIRKYSKSFLISILVFLSLNFFGTAFSGLRHTIALSIILLSYNSFINRKHFKFFGIILIASLFHITSLIFVVPYLLSINNKVLTKKRIIVYNVSIVTIFLLVKFFGNAIFYPILRFVVLELNIKRFAEYATFGFSHLNSLLFLINYSIFAFASYFVYTLKKNSKDKKELVFFYKLHFWGTFFSIFCLILGEFNRISMFFSISIIFLIPECLNRVKKKYRQKLEIIVSLLLIAYFLLFGIDNYNLNPFSFF